MKHAMGWMGAGLWIAAAALAQAAPLMPGPGVNVSQSTAATEKAKAVRLAYVQGGVFRKAWLYTYADGPAGRQNVFARHSFDDGATWSEPLLLSRDAAGAATGGQSIATRTGLSFVADNDKPSVFAPPVTAAPMVLIAWNSAYCPQDPAAGGNAGSYASAVQGAGDLDGDGTPDRPYHCVWVASTTDPLLARWNVQQIGNGERDAIGEVLSGSANGNAFALAWQEDPAGLQPGEAEGRGDGGSGANVTGGTNIWYAFAAKPDGAVLRANVVQLSDNVLRGTGQPGASRANLQLSGSTAAVAYEESACPGGSRGKCIVYHSFPYAAPDTLAAGTIVSDVTRNARRVRLVLQGAASAGNSPLRSLLLWRESVSLAPGAPADIVVRRGLADPLARPGSTGFLGSDLLADAPQAMTGVAASGGNANAHRAIVRGSFVALAYDQTPAMDAANPEKTAQPSANYNLFFTRSLQSGEPGRWSSPQDLSRIDTPALTVVEPRMVPTPGTVVNPLTGTPDAGDTQDGDVIYIAYATEQNTLAGEAGRVYVARSTDQGASFEPFAPVSAALAGQSESQLRPMPDGSSAMVLWMGETTLGDAQSKDAMFAIATAPLPDLALATAADAFEVGSSRTVTLTVLNKGLGDARRLTLTGQLPEGLAAVGIGEPSACSVDGAAFSCRFDALAAGASRDVSITLSSASAGSYVLSASVSGTATDADAADNESRASILATLPGATGEPEPPPPVIEEPGGGCTAARRDMPVDPVLPLLAALSLVGAFLPRATAARRHPFSEQTKESP